MLTLPFEVANPIAQPVYPTQLIRGIPGMTDWWTTQQSETFFGSDARRRVRARMGSRLLQPSASTDIPFEVMTTSGGISRSPSKFAGVTSDAFWRCDGIAFGSAWNSVVCIGRGTPGVTGIEDWAILFPTPNLHIYSSPHRTASSGAVWTDGGQSVAGAQAPSGQIFCEVIAFNLTTGQVKRSMNFQTTPDSATFSDMVAVGAQSGNLKVGAKQNNQPYDGYIFDAGLAVGSDLLASTVTAANLRVYVQALYGVAL